MGTLLTKNVASSDRIIPFENYAECRRSCII